MELHVSHATPNLIVTYVGHIFFQLHVASILEDNMRTFARLIDGHVTPTELEQDTLAASQLSEVEHANYLVKLELLLKGVPPPNLVNTV